MTDEHVRISRVIRHPDPAREATMKDIAKVAGFSQSTVSRVLSGAPPSVRIKDGTRDRVIEVARGLGFRPNPVARALRGARTMLLGVIVGDITDPFFPGVIEAVSTAASARGYSVVLGHARGRAREAVALKAVLETRHCDAIILLGDLTEQPRVLKELSESRVPSVSLARGSRRDVGMVSVDVDDHSGISSVMAYLVGLGHQRIAYIGPRLYGDFPARRAAYHELARAHRLELHHGYDVGAANSPLHGAAAFQSLLALRVPPTAIVAATDLIAIGALNAAYHAGVEIPGDISVTGFDDLEISGFLVPPLTTVRMPSAEMAKAAVTAAIALVGTAIGEQEATTYVFVPELVVRKSCAPPARATATGSIGRSPVSAVRANVRDPGERVDRAPVTAVEPVLRPRDEG